jgi:hypothetical protein
MAEELMMVEFSIVEILIKILPLNLGAGDFVY